MISENWFFPLFHLEDIFGVIHQRIRGVGVGWNTLIKAFILHIDVYVWIYLILVPAFVEFQCWGVFSEWTVLDLSILLDKNMPIRQTACVPYFTHDIKFIAVGNQYFTVDLYYDWKRVASRPFKERVTCKICPRNSSVSWIPYSCTRKSKTNCTEHGTDTIVIYAEFRNHFLTQELVWGKHDFAKFKLNSLRPSYAHMREQCRPSSVQISQRQVIVWTNTGILLIRPLGTNFSEILIEIYMFSLKKMHLNLSSGNWWPVCFDVLICDSERLSKLLQLPLNYFAGEKYKYCYFIETHFIFSPHLGCIQCLRLHQSYLRFNEL